jgi:hypothetical protein
MINISYNRTTNTTGVDVGNLVSIETDFLTVKFQNIITGEIHYSTKLYSNTWCKWQGAELITDVLFYNSDDELIHHHKWDVTIDGDQIEKYLWYYLKNRKLKGLQSNGLVIGTHDGRNGHWIYSIKNRLSNATLIDGSEKQFQELSKNYNNTGLTLINEIVTVNGGLVTWYQGGEGYTDTVKNELILDWLPENEITKIEKNSISFKKIIEENNFDWIHLDVEGIDGELILSLEKLPNVIIYESMNLDEKTTIELDYFFKTNKYKTVICNGNTMAIKEK